MSSNKKETKAPAREPWRPDWQDDTAYEWIKEASDNEVAWEFLRRNEQYAKDCQAYPMNPAERMFGSSSIDDAEYFRTCKKYLVVDMYPPAYRGQAVEFCKELPWDCTDREHLPEAFWPAEGYFHNDLGETIHYLNDAQELKEEREVIIKFTADSTLSDQLKDAAKLLTALASEFDKMQPQAKRARKTTNRTLLIRHLRALDAHHSGASIGAIGRSLGGESDTAKENDSKAGKEVLQPALEYRDSKYKLLVLRQPTS